MSVLAQRIQRLHPSPIRQILALIERPDMVSFAGGLPAQTTFPAIDTSTMPTRYLQYGETEGEPELRNLISLEMAKIGLQCSSAQVLVLSGSQQGIDLCAKLFVDHHSPVAIEAPTYLAALQVFRLFGADFQTFNPASPHSVLDAERKPELIYAIPTFQNPSGHCYTEAERQNLANLCSSKDIMLFEDDPYRDLSYEPCERTPICSQMQSGSWIYQGSFSKTLAPGLRLGFMVCSSDLVTPLTHLKQAADLHSNRLSQWLVTRHLKDPNRENRIRGLVAEYRSKRDIFSLLLREHFSSLASWKQPQGGLFFWLKLATAIDTNELLLRAVEQNVAFMPGEYFFPEKNSRESYIRLNFSHASEQEADTGLSTLAGLIKLANIGHL